MSRLTINASSRSLTGKNANSRLRASHKIPAVLYGKNQEAIMLELDEKEATLAIKKNNRLYDLVIDGQKALTVLLKEVQTENIKGKFLHVDFQSVEKGLQFKAEVPFRILNSDKAHGVKMGGQFLQLLFKVKVQTDLEHLPDHIDIDAINLGNSQSILIRHLNIEGVKLLKEGSAAICNISKARSK
jgi:large subunit ribosomal protein L25